MPTQAERQTADCEHYHGRCPTSNNTKQGEDDEWEEHDGIRKADQEWVTKVNAANIKRMRQELVSGIPKAGSTVEADPIWEALVDCPITLTMSKLLNLVPRFLQAMEARLQAVRMPCGSNIRNRVEEKNAVLMQSLGLHSIRGRDRERERESKHQQLY